MGKEKRKFGTPNPFKVGYQGYVRGYDFETGNYYRFGSDKWKLWREGWRAASRDKAD